MLAYVIAGIMLLLFLLAAYRMFGGAASAPVDSHALLRRASLAASAVSSEVARLRDSALATARDRPSSEEARATRRRVEGLTQQLLQVEPAVLDDRERAAHTLLEAAAEELTWCVRLLQSPSLSLGGGLKEAAAALCDHAERCAADAGALLEASAVTEEVHRPA